MNIPINKNIDEYKDDFFKGLPLRQCIYSIATLVVGAGAFFVSGSVMGLPQMVSVYVTILFAIPIAAVGFVKIHGMPVSEYIRKKKETAKHAEFLYESEESIFIEDRKELYREETGILHSLIERITKRWFLKVMLETSERVKTEEAERWLNN